MHVYVAGRTSSYEKVREIHKQLTDAGHTITYDWTRAVPDEAWESQDAMASIDPSPDFMRGQALNDINGVLTADVLVLVAGENMVGSYIEVGAALAFGDCEIIIVGEVERMSVFYFLPQVSFSREEDLLEHPAFSVAIA